MFKNNIKKALNAWELDAQNQFIYAFLPSVYFCLSFPKPSLALPWRNVGGKQIQRLVIVQKWVLR